MSEATNVNMLADRPLLSIVIICSPQDLVLLPECLQCLPKGAEVIVGMTEKTQAHIVQLNQAMLTHQDDNGKVLKIWYSRLDFAELRNRAKSFATGQWILSLDVDEILSAYQHAPLFDMIRSLPDTVDGVRLGNVSAILDPLTNEYKYSACGAVRLFRNKPGIDWYGCVHESPAWNINPSRLIDSSIIIHHTGYDTDAATILKKYGRNITLCARALTEADTEEKRNYYFNYLTKTCHSFSKLQEGGINGR